MNGEDEALERLLAVCRAWEATYPRIAAGETGPFEIADAELFQDLLDGAALRRLRKAIDADGRRGDWALTVSPTVSGFWAMLEFEDGRPFTGHEVNEPTIAAAADACREAIEADR